MRLMSLNSNLKGWEEDISKSIHELHKENEQLSQNVDELWNAYLDCDMSALSFLSFVHETWPSMGSTSARGVRLDSSLERLELASTTTGIGHAVELARRSSVQTQRTSTLSPERFRESFPVLMREDGIASRRSLFNEDFDDYPRESPSLILSSSSGSSSAEEAADEPRDVLPIWPQDVARALRSSTTHQPVVTVSVVSSTIVDGAASLSPADLHYQDVPLLPTAGAIFHGRRPGRRSRARRNARRRLVEAQSSQTTAQVEASAPESFVASQVWRQFPTAAAAA